MPKRKFELVQGASAKFWHVSQKGKQQVVTYGRIGTDGQTKTKTFDAPSEAKKSANKLIAQKLKKGYVEVGFAGSKKSKTASKKTNVKSIARKSNLKKFDAKQFKGLFDPIKKRDLKGHPKLTDALLKKVEKQMGIKFPSALVQLLKLQNGGFIQHTDFKIGRRTYELGAVWPIRENGIGPLVPEFADHLEMAEHGRLRKPELIFPFYGDGHFFFALDYRKNGPTKEPEIIYLDIEYKISCKKICDSFETFICGWQKPNIGSKKSIDIDAVDPDSIIWKTTRRYLMKHEPRKPRATDSMWLCISDGKLDLYECFCWQYKRRNGEWTEEFDTELWTRTSIKLKDVFALEISGASLYVNPFQMRASKKGKPATPPNTVTENEMERRGIGKPWVNKRAKKTFVFKAIHIANVKKRKAVLQTLQAAVKKAEKS